MSHRSLKTSREHGEVIGRGRLQLRQSGKHLVLMSGFKDAAVRFDAEKYVDKEVEILVRLTDVKPRVKRQSAPRIRFFS